VLPGDADDLPMKTVGDVASLLALTVNEVRKGKLDPKVANCVGYLASVQLRALDAGDLAAEVAELRRLVEGMRGDHGDVEAGGGAAPGGSAGAPPGGGGPAGPHPPGPGGGDDPDGLDAGPVADDVTPLFA
jgi:hypothetical protein